MDDLPLNPVWGKCKDCGHCWPIHYAPVEITLAALALKRATCPVCCAIGHSITMAKQDNGVLKEPAPGPYTRV